VLIFLLSLEHGIFKLSAQFIYRLILADEIRIAADSTLVIKVPGHDGHSKLKCFSPQNTL